MMQGRMILLILRHDAKLEDNALIGLAANDALASHCRLATARPHDLWSFDRKIYKCRSMIMVVPIELSV